MSASSQEPSPLIDMNAAAVENEHPPGADPEPRRPVSSRAAHVRAIHELVRANDYVVPAGLVAERMLTQAVAGEHDSQE